MTQSQITIYEELLVNAKEAKYAIKSLTERNGFLMNKAFEAARQGDLKLLKEINCEMKINNNYMATLWDDVRAPAAYKTQVFVENTQAALKALNELRKLIKR